MAHPFAWSIARGHLIRQRMEDGCSVCKLERKVDENYAPWPKDQEQANAEDVKKQMDELRKKWDPKPGETAAGPIGGEAGRNEFWKAYFNELKVTFWYQRNRALSRGDKPMQEFWERAYKFLEDEERKRASYDFTPSTPLPRASTPSAMDPKLKNPANLGIELSSQTAAIMAHLLGQYGYPDEEEDVDKTNPNPRPQPPPQTIPLTYRIGTNAKQVEFILTDDRGQELRRLTQAVNAEGQVEIGVRPAEYPSSAKITYEDGTTRHFTNQNGTWVADAQTGTPQQQATPPSRPATEGAKAQPPVPGAFAPSSDEKLPREVAEELKRLGRERADLEQRKESLKKEVAAGRNAQTGQPLKKEEFTQKEEDIKNIEKELEKIQKRLPLGPSKEGDIFHQAYRDRLQQHALQRELDGLPKDDPRRELLKAQLRAFNDMYGELPGSSGASSTAPTTGASGFLLHPVSYQFSGHFTSFDAGQVSSGGVNDPILYVTYAEMDQFMEDLYWDEWPSDPEERALQREIQRRINSPAGWNSIMVFQPGGNGDFTARFQEEYEEGYGSRPPYIRFNVNYLNESSYTDLIVKAANGGVIGCKKSMNPWFSNIQYTLNAGDKLNLLNLDFGTGGPDTAKQDWLDYLKNDQGLHDLRQRLPATETWQYYMAPFGTGGDSVFGVLRWHTTIEGHTPVTRLQDWIGHDPNDPRFVAPAPSLDPRQWPSGEARALPYARVEGLIP
jgi:hypothetical protein